MSLPAVHDRRAAMDVALAASLIVLAEIEALTGVTERPLWLHMLLIVPIMGSLAWRRRFPLAVLAIVVSGVLFLDPDAYLSVFAALVIASYTTGSELDPPRAWWGLAMAVGPMLVGSVLIGGGVSDFVAISLLYGGSWFVGQTIRERSRRADELAERAATVERERQADAERAVALERARIARELHDIVSHSISVITVQTQAVRRRLDPGQEREADDLRAIETTARQAMAEMRRLFGVLRADGERPALAPQPGLDQLDRLLTETREAGVPTTLVTEGEPVPLPPGVDLAAYRVVQEALTNVRKHAATAQACVRLHFGDRELEVTVADDGPPASRGDGGYGLIGMRERVAIYGGTLEASPKQDGGFLVHATLPFRDGARV